MQQVGVPGRQAPEFAFPQNHAVISCRPMQSEIGLTSRIQSNRHRSGGSLGTHLNEIRIEAKGSSALASRAASLVVADGAKKYGILAQAARIHCEVEGRSEEHT